MELGTTLPSSRACRQAVVLTMRNGRGRLEGLASPRPDLDAQAARFAAEVLLSHADSGGDLAWLCERLSWTGCRA